MNEHKHNDDGTTHIFIESKSKHFPGNHTIIIDTEDWDKVKEYRWSLGANGRGAYPYAHANIPHPDGGYRKLQPQYRTPQKRYTMIKIHQLIMGKPPKGLVTDHIEHNGLDNRKENLRFVTRSQNQRNTKAFKKSRYGAATSQYKGVSWCNTKGDWQVRIYDRGKNLNLGSYDCEHEAALAYNKKAIEIWDAEYVLLNVVPQKYLAENNKK